MPADSSADSHGAFGPPIDHGIKQLLCKCRDKVEYIYDNNDSKLGCIKNEGHQTLCQVCFNL